MKQTTLLTLWVLIIGCFACSPVYEPQFQNPNGIGNTTTTSPSPKPVAQFTFNTTAPLKVIFKNASTSATRYEWSFGDGSTSSEESPTHKYAQKGVYKVKLRATGKSGSDTYETNVTVENPTRIYFDGVTYEKLSVQNEYIKFKLIDDDIFTTVWYHSGYTLLSSANLPHRCILNEPILMDGLYEDDYYVINVYYSTSKSGDGSKLAGFRFDTSELYDGYPETLSWKENNGNKISCHFSYK